MLSIRPLRKRTATLLATIVAAIVLGFDLSQPLGISAGMPYVVLPLLGLLARSSKLIIATAIAGTVLVGIGMWLSPAGLALEAALINRVMSTALIWVTAGMALRHLYVGNQLQQQLRDLAATDPLTGLYNRRHVFEVLHRELKRYERYRESLALILIDADHFKQINDRWGHVVGDATLRFIAETCMKSVRETDLVGRFGGEEFVILLPHTTCDEAAVVAERIRLATYNASAKERGDAAKVTLSLGVTEAGPGISTFDDILKSADEALYAAKHAGRDRVATLPGPKPNPRSVQAVS